VDCLHEREKIWAAGKAAPMAVSLPVLSRAGRAGRAFRASRAADINFFIFKSSKV